MQNGKSEHQEKPIDEAGSGWTVGRTPGRSRELGWNKMDLRVLLSPPDEWCLLPTSLFNIYGEWGQWDITHHQGDWRKLEENMEEDEEITMRRYQCCKK